MRLRFFTLIAAALTFCGQAAPAQAQSVSTVLDVLTTGSNMLGNTTYDPCRIYSGLNKINCRVRAARMKATQVDAITHRVQTERKQAENRRLAQHVQISPERHPTIRLRNCINGNHYACQVMGITKEQAKRVYAERSRLLAM